MSEYSLGVDIGTSGIRTAVLDNLGNLLSTTRVPHESPSSTLNQAVAWERSVYSCLHAQCTLMVKQKLDPNKICRLAVDGTSGSMVLTDAQLKPITEPLMYNSKGFIEEAKIIAKYAPDPHITLGSSSALARVKRLLWQDTESQAVYLLHQADFITARLMQQGGFSDYNNALKTGFDPETKSWPDWLADVGVPISILPNPMPAGTPLGTINKNVADIIGLSKKVIIHAGTTDSIAAFIAAAPIETGVAVTSLGSTLVVKVLSPVRIDVPVYGLYSHKFGDNWLVGGASNTGGGVLLDYFSVSKIKELSDQIDPSKESKLDYYPLNQPGERFPINDPYLSPVMTPRPKEDVEFLHGLLESIARIEKRCYELIVKQGGEYPTKLYTAGGGAQNAVWTKIRERVLGLNIEIAKHTEAAVGTAKCCLIKHN